MATCKAATLCGSGKPPAGIWWASGTAVGKEPVGQDTPYAPLGHIFPRELMSYSKPLKGLTLLHSEPKTQGPRVRRCPVDHQVSCGLPGATPEAQLSPCYQHVFRPTWWDRCKDTPSPGPRCSQPTLPGLKDSLSPWCALC